jgi:DNA-binding LacI/PurR family transcriptional regulator
METIKDIAKACGVGVSTVSRAINNHPDINPETKEMILKVIKECNYIPNNSARNLKRSNAKAIAVLVKGITNPFFSNMIGIFEKETQKKKYTFILQRVEENENEMDVAIELIKEKRLRGIIFLGSIISHSPDKLKQLDIPFVLSTSGVTNTSGMESGGWSSVSVDDYAESYKMVDYLCKAGHKKIAMIAAGRNDESIGMLRMKGYLQALKDNNIQVSGALIKHMDEPEDQYNMATGYRLMRELMEEGKEFTAVYAIADSLALGACRAIRESGKEIPGDYSVAGFDGIEMGMYYVPSLTTIRQPVEEIAKTTIDLLFDIIRNEGKHKEVILPASLVIRESTRDLLEND